MENEKLQKLLEQVQNELEHTQDIDAQGQEMLQALDKDIKNLLGRIEKGQLQAHPSTIQRLENTIDHFEVTHPTLSATLAKLLAVLGNAGI